ncbi:MAG: pentapeptide repeat-containing protein [Cyanobacteria bacterium P01_F01_bin.56]
MMSWSWKRNATPNKSPEEKQQQYTEQIAYELYQNRVRLGKAGNAQSDWQTAERIVNSPLKTTLFASHRPFIKLEKQVWEPLLKWADNQALLSLLGIIGNVGLILAVVTYVGSEKQRRDAEVRNAWQTITSAHGQAGSGGRIEALEFLNASPGANWRRRFPWFCAPHPLCTWPAENLDGIDLSVGPAETTTDTEQSDEMVEETSSDDHIIDAIASEKFLGIYLSGVQLPNADLENANLKGADLENANLARTDLGVANLEDAFLRNAHLEEASLWNVNLNGAFLASANLEGAFLGNAHLEEAFLGGANLARTDLVVANLRDANLHGANLHGANLHDANLEEANLEEAFLGGANLHGANLKGAVQLTTEQLMLAKLCRTHLPAGLQLHPNRDCEELGIDPETGGRL